MGLRTLLQRTGQKVSGAASEWNAVANATWREIFNIERFETASRKFASEILTDGKSVSVVLRKPKRKSTQCNINPADYDVVWGLDPSRRNLFVATNQFGDKVSCSRREYYFDTHINESNQIIRHWQHSRKDIL
uniref:Uncharacterized protein n=1 Tax=Globisporangium ultimum (strain ATCC 200006 / CBS 805.95 / DAOM BR144) TaxID=431595 RepID=K3X646_GLOUD